MNIEVKKADLGDSGQVAGIIEIIDSYAREPLAGGQALTPEVRDQLSDELDSVPGLVIFLALLDGEPAGAAVCFLGYSTFKARPLLNIHDLAVLPKLRSRGLGRALLEAVEHYARDLGCCKLTLEVREENVGARRLYRGFGFGTEVLPTIFLEKRL
jgi:ribosomal protein S18 acetylase RimI-like enzyme